MIRLIRLFLLQLIVPCLFLVIWELLARYVQNSVVLPSLGEVFARLSRPTDSLLAMGSLIANIGVSLSRVLAGYILAIFIAVPIGLCMGYSSIAHNGLSLFLGLFRAIPPLAWVPLVLAWFGVSSLATLMNLPINSIYVFFHNLDSSMKCDIF